MTNKDMSKKIEDLFTKPQRSKIPIPMRRSKVPKSLALPRHKKHIPLPRPIHQDQDLKSLHHH